MLRHCGTYFYRGYRNVLTAFVGLLEAVSGVLGGVACLFVLVLGVQTTVANCWNVLIRWCAVPWFTDITFDVFGHTETH